MRHMFAMVTVLSVLAAVPPVGRREHVVQLTPDAALYLASAHMAGTIMSPSDGTMVRLMVTEVKNGVAYVGLTVWAHGRTASEAEMWVIAGEIEPRVLVLFRLTASAAGVEKYVRGVRVVPIEGSTF